MTEYYIRQPESEDARGPFDLQRIADLVEANQADVSTLYYDEDRDDWLPIVDNFAMREVVFPEKRHLTLKSKDVIDTVNFMEEETKAVSVDEMLAAAEGKTPETKHLKARQQLAEKAASLTLPALGIMLLLITVSLIYPKWEAIELLWKDPSVMNLMQHPWLLIGFMDAFLMLCCFLSVTDAFPLIRFRVMLGLGYFGYLYWAWQDIPSMAATITASLAIYLCTASLNFFVICLAMISGIAASGALAFLAIQSVLGA